MDILQLRGELSGANAAGIYFRGSAAYGWVLDGVNQDSDYAGDNRTLEFSRSLNDVNGSRVLDISGGLGAAFFVGDRDQYRIIPMAGYSYHNQHFRMRNGNQVISDSAYFDLYNPDPTKDVHPVGPIFGLNSSYDANWHGPWLGVDVLLDLQEGGTAFVRLEGHAVKYYAKANWNLRDDFAHPVSFEHEADGQGWVLELGWRNPLSRYYWTWGATVSLQSWTTDPGTDRIYLANNNYFEGRLNEANWSSRSLNITLSKNFSD